MNQLDIGCGQTKLEGWDGVDIENFGQKYVIDVEKDGLKGIPDNSIDNIRAWNFLEHISMDRELFVMNELNRVLRPGGKIHIKVPKFPSDNAVQDPTHKSFWVTKKFTYYYAGKSPRNAIYRDHLSRPMAKWGICNDGKDHYLLEEDDRSIDIWMYK